MTIFINWMQYSQQGRDGTFQTEGNPVASHVSPASGAASIVAPDGTQYVTVSSDANFSVSASNIKKHYGSDITTAYPAGTVMQIPNITVGATQITVTEL